MMARWIRQCFPAALDFEEAALRLAVAQSREASPIVLWGESATEYRFALIAPTRLAPGRRSRWAHWGLAPAVAAYRRFGIPACLGESGIWLHGRRIAECLVEAVGECALVASPLPAPLKCAAASPRDFEEAFRLRVEAQHGWTFDHSWPSQRELLHFAVA
ncbi:MAG: hypothetical protein JO035_05785 [Betaproteobacteria bacterium]|nr:hypothetical protein [Betaproteobacteria bacterium]